MQDNVNGKDEEIENIENDYELSCSKEDDSGFWDVSAASIAPCLSDEDESFDITNI